MNLLEAVGAESSGALNYHSRCSKRRRRRPELPLAPLLPLMGEEEVRLDEGEKVERVKDGVGGGGWSRSDFGPRLWLRKKITVFISAAPRRNRGGSHCCVKSLGAQNGRQKEREKKKKLVSLCKMMEPGL